MEYLTNKIEEKANEILDKMEKMGGIASTEGSKWVEGQLEEALQEYYGGLDEGVLPRVGMNTFALPGEVEPKVEIHRIPNDAGVRHIAKVKEIRQRRDNIKVDEALKELSEVAIKRKSENLIPYIIEAVEQYATVGEIFKTIKRAYGISWI